MTRVLFVCVRNRGKSPMAAGLLRQLSAEHQHDNVVVSSAGTQAGSTLNALSVETLAEVGVDISDETPRQLTDDMLAAADLVITLGDEAQIDLRPGPTYQTWRIDEPSQRGIDGIERMRIVRDDITRHVHELQAQLTRHRSP